MKGLLMTVPVNRQIDLIAEDGDGVQVEIQHELGNPGKFKLYVHVNGETLLRVCKLKRDQITVERHDRRES